jgi:hypothetical protein
VKAPVVKALAETYDAAQLAALVEAISEREEDPAEVGGDDVGEKLAHVLLAQRIRARVDAGEALKDAFRAEMAGVRTVLANG